MANEVKLTLRQSHKLVMTPMLQQAIKLLPLARMELVSLITQEMLENPFLEEELVQEKETDTDNNGSAESADIESPADTKDENPADVDWDTYFQENYYSTLPPGGYAPEHPSLENTIRQGTSLREHLAWQLTLSAEDDGDRYIGTIIIGNIDDDGYLRTSLDEIAQVTESSVENVEKSLELIQSFDPPGVGARDLKECLLLQIKNKGPISSLAASLIEKYIDVLEDKNLQKIAKEINVPINDLVEAVKIIRELNPEPGNRFNPAEIQYTTPDVIVVKTADGYHVLLNDEGIPRLRVSHCYHDILHSKNKNEAKEYIKDKFKSALWFIKSIEQRRQTIYKVAKSIIKFQREFLDNGLANLRPLVLKEVADDIGMHESTVSRVTTNKYMYTPQGMFELKFFFHSGISSSSGDVMSSIRVKEMIRDSVSVEDVRKPLTDQQIVELLIGKGVNIARRTVTKYRKELKISSGSKRKRRFEY
ncbi:MAG: RNA polymerase factor sigma-54 [Nitrospinae bacterium]|nr:RNA polymerase factor sigma-54 [Nitrospinota bacterium]MBI3813633.1 RNA polymerase factor sigma-54 [Nitrospinota bacterium]